MPKYARKSLKIAFFLLSAIRPPRPNIRPNNIGRVYLAEYSVFGRTLPNIKNTYEFHKTFDIYKWFRKLQLHLNQLCRINFHIQKALALQHRSKYCNKKKVQFIAIRFGNSMDWKLVTNSKLHCKIKFSVALIFSISILCFAINNS